MHGKEQSLMNMKIADTNIFIRHLLKDNIEQYAKTEQYFLDEEIYFPIEIVSEVVFVLSKVYQIPRESIKESLLKILNYENINCPEKELITKSLEVFSISNLGFIDCILYSYNEIKNIEVLSFDESLVKSIQTKKY